MTYHFFPDHEDAYLPEHEHIEDERQQQDDRGELEFRLCEIMRSAQVRLLSEDEVRCLCAGCGIDAKSVT